MKPLTYRAVEGIADARKRPERILQFGEGVFLRAFVDDLLDDLIARGLYADASVAVVQPLPYGRIDALNAQEGLYTLLLRGLREGKLFEQCKVVSALSRGIDPYRDYDDYMRIATSPDLRFVFSNTTEAGIADSEQDAPDDRPQRSFPGKVTALLYARYERFGGDPARGLVFVPCELIDDNGTKLRELVLRHARRWGLGADFERWMDESCTFCNTLVDRIVTGYPADEAEAICARLGYEDAMLDTAEPFSLFTISGFDAHAGELPLDQGALNVRLVPDVTPYKRRKVRILNGAHTALTSVALLCGMETVGEAVADPQLAGYAERAIYDEVIPTLDLEKQDLLDFARSTFERFRNPFIKHKLTGIALNTTSKWRARVLPSVEEYLRLRGHLPRLLCFSFAAALALFRAGQYDISDSDDIEALYEELKAIAGFQREIERGLADIDALGCRDALAARMRN